MTLWAVVPVKPFGQAKQRLAGVLDGAARAVLAACMLRDVLATLRAAPALAGTLVVTADDEAGALAREAGAHVQPEPEPAGLNEAVRAAAAWVQAHGGTAMLVVPGDAPGVTAMEIDRLARAHARGAAVALVPAHDAGGTNALLISPPTRLAPAYGTGSFGRHLRSARAAGLEPQVLPLPGLGLDLDTPADLARYARSCASTHADGGAQACTHTARWLAVRAADSPLEALQRAGTSADTSSGLHAPATRSPAACPPRAPTAATS